MTVRTGYPYPSHVSAPMEFEATRGRRRLFALTTFAVCCFGAMLSIYGVFLAWLVLDHPFDVAFPWLVISVGVLLGFAAAGVVVWIDLAHAKAPIEAFLAKALEPNRVDQAVVRASELVAGVSIAAGVPAPSVHVVLHGCPNALAVGMKPESTDLYVTTGLLGLLNRDEQEAVVASVVTSIGRYDVACGTVAYAVGSGLSDMSLMWLSNDPRSWVITALLSPFWLAGWITHRLVLRWSGAERDAEAMAYTRYPPALHSALMKLRDDYHDFGPVPADTGHLWFETPALEIDHRTGEPRRLNATLDRRIEQVARALQAIDPTWTPPPARIGPAPLHNE